MRRKVSWYADYYRSAEGREMVTLDLLETLGHDVTERRRELCARIIRNAQREIAAMRGGAS